MAAEGAGAFRGAASNKPRCMYLLYIEAVSAENTKAHAGGGTDAGGERADAGLALSAADLHGIADVAAEPNLLQLLSHSLCPPIFGHEVVKAGLILGRFGGTHRGVTDPQQAVGSRADVHVLVVGDPGMGKSQMLTATAALAPRGVYVCGNTTSSSGLTVTVVKDQLTGDFVLEAGALVMGDQGCCCIDEFDKISPDDKRMMHPAMEQQKVHVAKGGITATLHSRCSILAAANPKEGRFTKRGINTSVIRSFKETGLPPPLASRFDIIWMIRDEVRIHDDERIARHILDNRTSGKSEAQLENTIELGPSELDEEAFIITSENGNEHLSQNFLRKYIAYAKRTVHPQLDEDAKNAILKYYTEERQSFGREDQSPSQFESDHDNDTVIPITARALEALIRLTEAHARMHLQEIATVDNAKVALAVFKHWREESGIEDESELHSGVSVKERSNNSTIMNIVRKLCQEKGQAELTEIYNIAINRKISEAEVDKVVQKMNQTGELYESSSNPLAWRFAR